MQHFVKLRAGSPAERKRERKKKYSSIAERWRKAKTLRKIRDAKERGDAYYDQTHATKIERREEVRPELGGAHLKSPTFALSEALRRVEV